MKFITTDKLEKLMNEVMSIVNNKFVTEDDFTNQLANKSDRTHTHNYAGSSSAGGAANSVKTNLIIKLNGGNSEGTDLFTFNGSTAKTIDITPSSIGAAASSHGTHLTLGTGSGNAYRGDYGNTAYNHSQAAHAPSNAQKNSDITKAEIEAKLTGAITSHSHDYITMNNCSNKDLNNIKTAGWYYGYTGMTNAPVQNISVLEVIVYSPDWIVQRFTVINVTGKTYERHYYNGNTWSEWKTLYDSNNKPTPEDIGAAAASHGTHLTLGTGSGNAYRGDYGNTAYTHSQAAHAPSNAQKNSDITKAEIEAKLTGAITSHSHTTVNGYSLWTGTQTEYNALSSKSNSTLYFIID